MNPLNKDTDIIDRYLSGKMTPSEAKTFEMEMSDDHALKERVFELKAIQAGITLDGLSDMLTEMESWESISEQNHLSGPTFNTKDDPTTNGKPHGSGHYLHFLLNNQDDNSSRLKWYKMIGIAATITFFGAVLWINTITPDNKRLPNIAHMHFPSSIGITRSTAPSLISKEKMRAYNLYEIKEYQLAAPLLELLYHEENDKNSLFYAGVAYLCSGQTDKATRIFQKHNWNLKQTAYIENELYKLNMIRGQ